MAEDRPAPKGKGKGLRKDFAGQPVWVWLVGAAVVVGGVWYFSRQNKKQGQGQGQGQGQQKPAGQQTPFGNTTFLQWLAQHQGPPSTQPPRPKPRPKHHQGNG